MKKIVKKSFKTGSYSNSVSTALLIFRVVAGLFMLTHGWGKFQMLIGDGPNQFPSVLGMGATASLTLAVMAEFFASILLIFGLGTRLAATLLLTTMLVAALIIHSTDPFSAKELPLMYSTIYLVILYLGAGKYSLDRLIFKK